MNVDQVKLLVWQTLQKEWRNRMFIFLFMLTIFCIVTAFLIIRYFFTDVLDPSATTMIGKDKPLFIFVGFINFFIWFVSLLVGLGVVKSDLETGVIRQIISLPISRIEYLFSRLIGGWILVMGFYLISVSLSYVLFQTMSDQVLNIGPILLAMIPQSFVILAGVTLTMIYSMKFSKIVAFIVSCITSMIISSANFRFLDDASFDAFLGDSVIGKILYVIHWMLPRMYEVNALVGSVMREADIGGSPVLLFLHFVITFGLVSFITSWFFRRRDF